MSYKLPCEIVRDLLPSYVDGLTSPVTGESVQEHLDTCEPCRDCYDRMRSPDRETPPGQQKELDYLRQIRRRHRRAVVASVLAAVLVIGAVLFVRTYLIGSPLPGNQVDCNDLAVHGTDLTLRGTVLDESRGISSIDFQEENGVVTATVNATRRSPFHEENIEASYTAQKNIKQVYIGDRILWDHGEKIISWVGEIYATKHPYVGDAPANSRTAQVLGLADALGEWSTELQTSSEPYVWTFHIKTQMPADEQQARERYLRTSACVLLALIDNLGQVNFEYMVDGANKTLIVTETDAETIAGQNIKECGKSPKQLQNLMRKTAYPQIWQ